MKAARADALAVAAWAGVLIGLADGVLLCVLRGFPRVRAPYKVPADVLWIAPLTDVLFVVAGAALLMPLLPLLGRLLRRAPLEVLGIVLVFAGAVLLLDAPKAVHPVSALVLGAGLAAAAARAFGGRMDRLAPWLRRRVWLVPAVIAVMFAGVRLAGARQERRAAAARPAADAEATSVLILMLDTVRRDRVGRPGESLTPVIDSLAAGAVRFTDAWSTTSWSLPSQASLLTGLPPAGHGAEWPRVAMAPGVQTLGDVLGARGYATGAFSGNSAWVVPEHLGRGFQRFDAYDFETVVRRTALGMKLDRVLDELGAHSAGRGRKAPWLQRRLLAFLDQNPGRPFFAYVCLMDANQALHRRRLGHPFWRPNPPPTEVAAAYDEGVRALDADVGRLLGELARRGALRRTIIVVTSDHGESFGAQNPGDHDPMGHGTHLYPEQTAIPLFFVIPGHDTAAAVGGAVSLAQVPATILRELGMTGALAGEPLPLPWRDSAGAAGRAVLATLEYDDAGLVSVMRDGWMYLGSRRDSVPDALFDLSADPAASRPRPADDPMRPPLRAELQRLLAAAGNPSLERPQ